MSLVFIDGAETYGSTDDADITTHSGRKWGTAVNRISHSTSQGQFGGKSLYPDYTGTTPFTNSALTHTLATPSSTVVLGVRIKWKAGVNNLSGYTDNAVIIEFLEGATSHLKVFQENAADLAKLTFRCGSTNIITITDTKRTTEWFYLEIKLFVDDTTGTLEIRIDGETVATFSGDTNNGGAVPEITDIRIQTGGASGTNATVRENYFDDVYIDDADFVPGAATSRIQRILPTADANYDQWSKSTGTDGAALVDEEPANDDTDYIFGASVGDRQSFALGDIGSGGNDIKGLIHAVALNSVVRNTGASNTLNQFVRINATDYDQANFTPQGSYSNRQDIIASNPDTFSPWELSEVNALEAGVYWQA